MVWSKDETGDRNSRGDPIQCYRNDATGRTVMVTRFYVYKDFTAMEKIGWAPGVTDGRDWLDAQQNWPPD